MAQKNNNIYNVGKGDRIFCDKYAPHSYGAYDEDPWSILWVHFSGQFTEYFASQLNIKDSCGIESIGYQPKVVEYLEKIVQSFNPGNNILNLLQSAAYLQLVLCHILMEKRFSKENAQSTNSYVDKVISYMKENIDKNFSLDELAFVAGLSKYHFTRCFKKATDYSPSEYFYRLKIQKACELLNNTEFSINEISTMLSYNNQYYFSRQFKEITGYPPSKFRDLINNSF